MNLNCLQIFLYQVSKQLSVPLSAALLIEILSSLQIIQLIFSSMAKFSPSSHFIITSLNKNMRYLTGIFPLEETSLENSILHSIWIICLVYLVFYLGLLLVGLRSGTDRLLKILSWLCLLHSRLLFFPIQFFLLNLCNMYSSSESSSSSSNLGFYQQTGWLAGSVILVLMNTSLALFKEFFMHQINQTEDHYAAKTNIYHQSMLVYKIIALLLHFWGVYGTSAATKGSTIFHFIMALSLMTILYMKLPFYKFRALRLTIVLTTMILCLSIISVLYVFTQDMEVRGGMHILILLLPPLAIKFALSQFRNLFKRILQGKFLTIDHVIHFGLLLEDFFMREKSNVSEDKMFLPHRESFYGVLALDNQIPLEKFSDKKLILECELPIYSHIIEKLSELNSKSKLLALYIAQISLAKLNNIPKGLEILRKLESSSSSLPMKSSIQYVNELLEKVYNEDGMGSEARLGLSHYFKYYDIANSVKTLMLTETNKQIEFWEDVRKRDLDVKKTYDKVEKIDSLFMKIRKECETNLHNFRKNFSPPMLLYSVYLTHVRQMQSEGVQVLRSFQAIMFAQSGNNELEAASGNVAVVIVSLDKAKAGIILNASGSIHNIFSHKKTELIGKKIGCLFPSSIAQMYQQKIQQYSKALEYKLDYKERTFGKTSADEIFELEAHFQLYPCVNKELTLMVMLRKLDDPAPVLIANSEGYIVDYSKTLEVLFQRESLNVKVFQSLQNLLPKSEDVNLAFNLVYGQTPQQIQNSRSKSWFTLENTALEFEDSSRYTGRSLLHGLVSRPDKTKKLPPAMPLEKAEEICQEYLEGKHIFLNPEILFQNKFRLVAHVSIRPFQAEEEIYKVVSIRNLKKDTSSIDVVQTFADQFPAENEKVKVEQVSPLKVPKTQGAIGSSFFAVEDKKSFLIESESETRTQLNEAQQKLDNLQRFQNQDDSRSSVMNSHYLESRTVRTLRDIGSRKSLQRGLGSLQVLLYIVIAGLLVLSFAKFELSKSSIEEIERDVNIINLATLRLQNAINTFLWSLAYVTGSSTTEAKSYFTASLAKFSQFSVQLENELGLVKDKEFINRAFQKDVRFWQLAVQGDDNEMLIDTFSVTNLLITKFWAIQETESRSEISTIPDLILTFNNTANDYLISSKSLISATDIILGEIISSDILLLHFVVATEMAALVSFTSVFIIMIVIMGKSYQRLCRALLRTQDTLVVERISELNKVKILLEDDIERKAFLQDGFDLLMEEGPLKKTNSPKTQKASHQQSNVQMSSMNKCLVRIAIICLIFIPMFAVLFVTTLKKSFRTFTTLESVNEELSMLSGGSLQSNLMMSTLLYASMNEGYSNMLVLNKAPVLQIIENLENFSGLNQKLIDTFISSQKREVDPVLAEILETSVCKYLSDSAKEVCTSSINGQRAGLLSMNSDYENIMRNIIASVRANLSVSDALAMNADILSGKIGENTVMMEIYPIMMAQVLEGFRETAQTSKDDEKIYISVIFVTLVVYAVFLSLKPLKDFKRVDIGRRKILKIIPFSIIQENKALKFYLMQDFKTEVEEIKNKF